MATPVSNSVALPAIDGGNGTLTDEFINGLVQGSSWQFGGGPRVITYSFNLNDGPGGAFTSAFVDAVNRALTEWSNVANIGFQNIVSGTFYFESQADIVFTLTGNELQTLFGAIGLGVFPDPAFANQQRDDLGYTAAGYPNPTGDIFLDNFYPGYSYLYPGGFGFDLILHEIGHALGLKHPGDNGGNGRPTFAQLGISQYNNDRWTIMSSNSSNGLTFLQSTNQSSPMPLDVLGVQQIYGANMSYHVGNDTYVLVNPATPFNPQRTIWDAGGTDTIDVGGAQIAQGARIDLRPGEESTLLFPGSVPKIYVAFGADIENALGGAGNDDLIGNALNNTLSGNGGSDTIQGGNGNDTLRGGEGNDALNGGAGIDTASFSDMLSSVIVNLAQGTATTNSGFGLQTDTLTQFENIVGSPFNDTLNGDAGSNVIDGGSGADTMAGGSGNDIYVVDNTSDNVDDTAGIDAVQSYVPWVLGATIENLTLLGSASFGAGNDLPNTLTGNSANNPLLRGAGGADTIMGGDGDDWIEGETGNDIFTGIAGGDTLNGENGSDTILGGAGDDVMYGGAGIDFLIGETGNDLAYGGSEFDAIDGRQGSDVLYGEDGDDIIFGDGYFYLFGFSNDSLFGGPGNDIMMGEAGEASLNGAGDALHGEDGNDILDGGAGDDAIYGGNGNDVIDGDNGNDYIVGGPGAEIMLGSNAIAFGGATVGSDLFVYQSMADAGDSIYGFDTRMNIGENDGLDLRSLFDTLGYAGTTPRATGTNLLQVTQSGADTLIQIDPDGAPGPQGFTTLVTLVGVTATTITDSFFLFQ